MNSKAHALKMRISSFLPGRKSVVDNTKNPTSASSMVMRATADKAKGPVRPPVSYHGIEATTPEQKRSALYGKK